jgi:hypothetical protein
MRQRATSCFARRNLLSGTARFVRSTKYASSACASLRQMPGGSSTGVTLIEVSHSRFVAPNVLSIAYEFEAERTASS